MRTLAARWLIDCVDLATQTVTAPTRATMAAGTHTTGTATRAAALVREPSVTELDTATVDRSVRDLDVWIDECVPVSAGMLCTIVSCGDDTLVGKAGTVLTVERDSLRAVRRCLVRMSNDA